MKRRVIAGVLVIVLGLAGCGSTETAEVTASLAVPVTTAAEVSTTATTKALETTTKATETTTTAALTEAAPDEKITLPVIDGSTSTIKLDAYIRSKILGISIQDASFNLHNTTHSKTFEAFENLVNGEADIVLSVPLAKEQEAYAAENNFEYEAVPIALEGFVFLVNPENPVQSLTQEQIRKIYSGEITNWKELGGEDAEILPYQRNGNSGSQTYMRSFMGETPLADAPESLVQGEMGAVVSMFESYDNSINAIGYSVYSYAAAFAANEGAFSFVEIDGVKPSRTTFIDGSYPLLSETYAFYKKGTTNQFVLDYVELITSEKGQRYVLEAGYIPVMDIEIPPAYTLYEAKGTGPEKPETVNRDKYHLELTEYNRDNARPHGFLKDAEFEAEVQAWIDETLQNLPEWVEDDDIRYYAYIENGLLGISVGDHGYNEYAMMNQLYGDAAVFDIINNKKIENFSDLFYKDTDFMTEINKVIAYDIRSAADLVYTDYTMKCDFFGLCEGFSFDLDEIYMPEDNAFFGFPASFFIKYYRDSDCLDFKEYLTPEYAEQVEFIEFEADVNSYQDIFYEKDGHLYIYFDYSDIENDRELPENMMIEEAFDAYYADDGYENGTQRVSVKGKFVGISINYEGPARYYCTLQHKFIELADFFKEGFIEHLSVDPDEKNPDNLTAQKIYNDEYSYGTLNEFYATPQIVTQINDSTEEQYIIIDGYGDTPKLRIDKEWLKDIYQNPANDENDLEFTKKQEYFDEKSKSANDILISDFNNGGISDAVFIYDSDTTFAYYNSGEIKEISANANWGGECECENGAPLYYNKKTDEFLAVSTYSSYKNYSFYDFSDGDYKLKNEYTWREIITPWDVEKWIENPNFEGFLQDENLTLDDLKKLDEGELLGFAWALGTFDRVNQYMVDDKEVNETEWQNYIDDFINADDCILLCSDNADLQNYRSNSAW